MGWGQKRHGRGTDGTGVGDMAQARARLLTARGWKWRGCRCWTDGMDGDGMGAGQTVQRRWHGRRRRRRGGRRRKMARA